MARLETQGRPWPRGAPHWRRVSEISRVLTRHGLGTLAWRITSGVPGGIELGSPSGWRHWPRAAVERVFGPIEPETDWPTALREALVELGPAFVKVGQLLSVRSDLVPSELALALRSLRSDVPPVPFSELAPTLEAALGAPIEQVFSRFEPVPIAAASIAQVHDAVLPDGTRVAVKIKRPGIDAVIERDLEVLVWLAERLERHMPRTRSYRPVAAARELAVYTRRELDFRNEGRVAARLGEHFVTWFHVAIPRIHHSSRHVLVMDHLEGAALDDLAAIEAWGLDRMSLLRTTVECMLEQILGLGLFHADPHPGNLRIAPDGRLILLDFGIFGELDSLTRHLLMLAQLCMSRGEFDASVRYMLRLASLEAGADPLSYRHAVGDRYRAWRSSTVGEYGFARLIYDVVNLGARHGVVFPPAVILYVKAMTTLEGVALDVVPEVNMAEVAKPYLEGLARRMADGPALRGAWRRALPFWMDLAERLPTVSALWAEERLEPPPSHRRDGRSRPDPFLPAVALAAGAVVLVAAPEPTVYGLPLGGLALLGLAAYWAHPRSS